MTTPRPRIGITVDNGATARGTRRYESAEAYADAVYKAGGTPLLLPQEIGAIPDFLQLCHGFLFTGGGDPDMTAFGKTTDPRASLIDPRRQAFELALYKALDQTPTCPVLGICLGMQLMGLHRGAELDQHLPDTLPSAQDHRENSRHAIRLAVDVSPMLPGTMTPGETVVSWHRQALVSPGDMRVVARAHDGVIEAIDDPTRRFYAGVQWHPERGGDGELSLGVIRRLVEAARKG